LRRGAAEIVGGVEQRNAVERLAEHPIIDSRKSRDGRHQIMVPLHRVRREIGHPEHVAGGQVTDRQRPAVLVLVVAARRARPVIAVFGNAGVVIGPAAGIGAGIEVGELEHDLLARGGNDAEMEPLEKLGRTIAPDREPRGRAVDPEHVNIAAVERGIDK